MAPGLCLRELEKQIAKDVYDGVDWFHANKITLNDCWDQYISSKLGLKTTTRSNYKHLYKKHISSGLGGKTISSIKYSTVKNFYVQLLQSGLQMGTIKNKYIVHKIMLLCFEQNNSIIKVPCVQRACGIKMIKRET